MTSQLTPKQIFENIQQTIDHYVVSLVSYSEAQFIYKSNPEVWSLGQLYEHLYITSNFFFLAQVVRCLEHRKGQMGGEKNQYGDNIFKHNGFPPLKFKIPEVLQGPEPIAKTRTEYQHLLLNVITDAEKLIETVTSDEGEYKCFHPVFGWLNAHEWYHNLDMHLRHHLRQQQELTSLLPINLV
ncbi:DinB family protein [Runella sp. MFBS21]|uniref:DinB family protein n=1 Tax=Runella sp. MFBS21 TaxID=3034018 RepID=UPI0023F669C6|nr:DinB family protein [Runella sp. MFBS21]MDF7821477.1 DinB family protein [Runella sp. MFBS21]